MKTYTETAVEKFTGVEFEPRHNSKAIKNFAEYRASIGRPLPAPVDVSGVRTRPTSRPAPLVDEIEALKLQDARLALAERQIRASRQSIRQSIIAKGGTCD